MWKISVAEAKHIQALALDWRMLSCKLSIPVQPHKSRISNFLHSFTSLKLTEITIATKVSVALLLLEKNSRNKVLPAAPLQEARGLGGGGGVEFLALASCVSGVTEDFTSSPQTTRKEQPHLGTFGNTHAHPHTS